MTKIMLIMLGGAIGTGLRYGIGEGAKRLTDDPFPFGTLTVNVVGCLAIGVLGFLFAGTICLLYPPKPGGFSPAECGGSD